MELKTTSTVGDGLRALFASETRIALVIATVLVGGALATWGIFDRVWVEGGSGAWSDYADAYERTQWMTPLGVVILAVGLGVSASGLAWLAGLNLSVSVGPTEAGLGWRGAF